MSKLAVGGAWLVLLAVLLSPWLDSDKGERLLPLPSGVEAIPYGHKEVDFSEGLLLPRWINTGKKIGVCLETPIGLDTSQWLGQVTILAIEEERVPSFEPPFRQAGNNLCFGRVPPTSRLPSSTFEVCLVIEDGFEVDQRYRVPCFRWVYDKEDSATYDALYQRLHTAIESRTRLPPDELLSKYDQLAAAADEAGFPALSLLSQDMAIEILRQDGSDEALAQAESRLTTLPTWLDQPAATPSAIIVTLGKAKVASKAGRLREAWEHLNKADDFARRYVSYRRIAVTMARAEILTRLGQLEEPQRRLGAALEGCERLSCESKMQTGAHRLFAWLIMIDPDATSQALEQARKSMQQDPRANAGEPDNAELANFRINLALLASRLGEDPGPALTQARASLELVDSAPKRAFLRAWANVVVGLDSLAHNDAPRALTSCAKPANSAKQSRVISWAWSCMARAHRQLGHARQAVEGFEQAIHHGLEAQSAPLGQDLSLAPGRLADDYFRAARLAVEQENPQRAWELLVALDRAAARNGGATLGAPSVEKLQQDQALLNRQLDAIRPPLAPERSRQVAPLRQELLAGLEEIHRTLSARTSSNSFVAGGPANLRAFALEDEVILLARARDGEVTVARRTPLLRSELHEILDRLDEAQRNPPDDAVWRKLARPLAEALVPAMDPPNSATSQASNSVTRYALHGLLQRVPLTALPLDSGGWLSSRAVPVWRPSFVERDHPPDRGLPLAAQALFVVDPRRNLPSGTVALQDYRRRFPSARVLYGESATRASFKEAMREASFIHIDAHGNHDPAFSQLSGLQLADAAITLADWPVQSVPSTFVNLSSCHIGGGVPSADSGRYGFAGALARRGIPWVIASSSVLDDQLAYEFNSAFYDAFQLEENVPRAFSTALETVRQRHPAAAWARLRLIGTVSGGGKTPAPLTIGE